MNTEDLTLEPTLLSSPPVGAPAAFPPPPPGIAPLAAPTLHDLPIPASVPGLGPAAGAPTAIPGASSPAPSVLPPPPPALAPTLTAAPAVPNEPVLAPPAVGVPTPVLAEVHLVATEPVVATAPVPVLAPAAPSVPTRAPTQAQVRVTALDPVEQPEQMPAPSGTATGQSALRRRGPIVLGIALLVGAAFLAYSAISGAGDTDSSNSAISEPAAEPNPASPILVPIEDAQNAVDQLNDNAAETELLEELGLDPTGRPIPPGYQFVTTDPSGASYTVQVDTTTGNYSVESADGFGYRSIDGATVARSSATDPWTPIDVTSVTDVQRFGLEEITNESNIVTPSIAPWTTVESRTNNGGLETTTYQLDVASLNAEQPGLLTLWAAPFGLDSTAIVSAASAPVEIEIVVDAQRVMQSFTIAAPGSSAPVSYRLETVYDTAPTISL